jgi:predicted AAA+ superfamily ATPase
MPGPGGFATTSKTPVLRDALDHASIRKPDEMLTLIRLLATRTAQVYKTSSVAGDLRLDRHTAGAYRETLRGLFIVEELPPWKSNRSQRLIKSPKIHITDTGLATSLLGVGFDGLRRDAALAGHVLESFVYNELAKQASWLDDPPALLHFSESERAEVDLVLERSDGGVLGVEVKLAAHIDHHDLRGLRRLRELAGDRWAGGAVLASVPAASRPPGDHDMIVVPISALWASG